MSASWHPSRLARNLVIPGIAMPRKMLHAAPRLQLIFPSNWCLREGQDSDDRIPERRGGGGGRKEGAEKKIRLILEGSWVFANTVDYVCFRIDEWK